MKWLPLLLLMSPAMTQAQTRDDKTRAVDEILACRDIRDDAGRLACFDRSTATLAGARASGELIVLDRKTVVARKQQQFGLANPSGDLFGGGEADRQTEVKQLDSKVVAAVAAKAYGRFDIQLANGSVWQTIDPLSFPPKVGADVTVKAGSLGSYRLSVAGERSVLAKRIR